MKGVSLTASVPVVVALAGRRVDPEHAAQVRFPLFAVERVRADLRSFFLAHQVCGLVCAAACGADILALEVAGELGLRRRVVLPLPPAEFRQTSVVDRGAAWGDRYDSLLAEVAGQGELVEADGDAADSQLWFNGNLTILAQAEELARQSGAELAALIVWDGRSRGADDVTAHFKQEAEARGWPVTEILTL